MSAPKRIQVSWKLVKHMYATRNPCKFHPLLVTAKIQISTVSRALGEPIRSPEELEEFLLLFLLVDSNEREDSNI